MYSVIETTTENEDKLPEVYKVPQSWILTKEENKTFVLYPLQPENIGTKRFVSILANFVNKCLPPQAIIFEKQEIECRILKSNLSKYFQLAMFVFIFIFISNLFLLFYYCNFSTCGSPKKRKKI